MFPEIGFYLIREMLECPAVLVTMLMSVRGLGSVERNSNHHKKRATYTANTQHIKDVKNGPESMVIDLGSFTG